MHTVSLVLALAFGELSPDCSGPLTRPEVVRCARRSSPRYRADLEHVEAARGDQTAARVLLPTNPELAVTLSHRVNSQNDAALNGSGTISQEIEIGGQRRKRIDVARARSEAFERRAERTEREVIVEALTAFYDVIASRREVEVMQGSLATAARLEVLAGERAAAGVGSPIDEDLAAAEHARVRAYVELARGRSKIAQARLASVLGADPSRNPPGVVGELVPLALPESTLARLGEDVETARPELAEVTALRRSESGNLALQKRSRVPNPRLSFFVQRDGLDERVIGGGLAFPLPLPAPLGHTNKGEIEASRARLREVDQRMAAAQRSVQLELAVAFHEFAAQRAAANAYPPASADRAQRTLADLATEIEAGRLAVRDALQTQAALQDLLLRGIEARHALCLASVELAFAAGLRFEGGEP